jgi:acyl-coenzyme A thioesterase PaaI-like protein
VRKIGRVPKKKRQEELHAVLAENPFLTDEELAAHFSVSIQTIRLDRMEQGIPELRERIKRVAEKNFNKLRALKKEEVIGEIIDLRLDEGGISILTIDEEHVFSRTKIARGHIIFAQANSLAVAITNAEVALTAHASIRFIRPVRLGERLIAKATVAEIKRKGMSVVKVDTYVKEEMVFTGEFRIFGSFDKHAEEERGGEHV